MPARHVQTRSNRPRVRNNRLHHFRRTTQTGGGSVRAIAANRYGDNRVLNVADVEDPKLGPDTIVVRTRFAGVNPVDWKMLRGYLDNHWPVHFPVVPCWDVAGVVEAAGAAVTTLQRGDGGVAYDREGRVRWGA